MSLTERILLVRQSSRRLEQLLSQVQRLKDDIPTLEGQLRNESVVILSNRDVASEQDITLAQSASQIADLIKSVYYPAIDKMQQEESKRAQS